MDIDEILPAIGGFGRFQQRAFAVFLLGSINYATQIVQNIFVGVVPLNQTCIDPGIDACDANCSKIEFNDYDGFSSYSIEWNMTCGSGPSEVRSTQSILMAGFMFGALPFGTIGDRYGRFKLLITCQVLYAVSAFASSFATSWLVYAVLRFLTGFFNAGLMLPWGVLMVEMVAPSSRRYLTTIPGLAFTAGLCILSGTAWITKDWRTMSVIFGVGGILLSPLLYLFYDESPRWLLKRNPQRAEQILRNMARVNKKVYPQAGLLNIQNKDENLGMMALLSRGVLIKITLIQALTWLTCSGVYYGLLIAAGEMGNSRYISVILNSLTEIPSYFISLYTVENRYIGRRWTGSGGLILSGLFCGAVWFVKDEHTAVIIGLACAGKFFSIIGYCGVHMQSNELYPTNLRNAGNGVLLVFNRIGGILAPQVVNLDNLFHNAHFIAFGVIGIVAGSVSLLLPETRGRPLPNNPDEIYGRRRQDETDGHDVPLIPAEHNDENHEHDEEFEEFAQPHARGL